jgi:hypothetical protein
VHQPKAQQCALEEEFVILTIVAPAIILPHLLEIIVSCLLSVLAKRTKMHLFAMVEEIVYCQTSAHVIQVTQAMNAKFQSATD